MVAREVLGVGIQDVGRHAWFGLLLKAWRSGAQCTKSSTLPPWSLGAQGGGYVDSVRAGVWRHDGGPPVGRDAV